MRLCLGYCLVRQIIKNKTSQSESRWTLTRPGNNELFSLHLINDTMSGAGWCQVNDIIMLLTQIIMVNNYTILVTARHQTDHKYNCSSPKHLPLQLTLDHEPGVDHADIWAQWHLRKDVSMLATLGSWDVKSSSFDGWRYLYQGHRLCSSQQRWSVIKMLSQGKHLWLWLCHG